ncbi:hypothetical protein C8N35_103282 [Breoghania corrubedonensis]|uniref:Uncharacterized protein n=1 Tax=Breoghania corrubedonensis TaxID=665038 RepID=A0A2T5VBI5_9HYPH|nr:hypothetical protein [Breoghania corrubedonensis]PTW61100.1 hypothetical protein C8N35_103282 [Breoghania corrubedonensis]
MFIKNKTLVAGIAALAIAAPSIALAANNNTRPIEGVISSPQPVGVTSNYGATRMDTGYGTRTTRPVEHVIAAPTLKSGVAFSRGEATRDQTLNSSTRPYEGVIAHSQPVGLAKSY